MTIKKLVCGITLGALASTTFLASCNKKKEEAEPAYTAATNVSLTSFTLKHDSENEVGGIRLDSVFFAIDIREGVVFNADSLPVGTKTDNMVPVLKYPSSVKSVVIEAKNGVFDYIASPGTAMDLSEGLKITLTSENGASSRTYNVKINVHNQNPAQFLWSQESVAQLPGGITNPLQQKTLLFGGETYCFVQGTQGSIALSKSSKENPGWITRMLQLGFEPELRSMTATGNALYVLSTQGQLYESSNGVNWTWTGKIWRSIVASYMDAVSGICADGTGFKHTCWPEGSLPESTLETDFPVEGFTNAGIVTTDWSPVPTIFICGGKTQASAMSKSVWGFDGTRWSKISSGPAPAVTGGILVPYWLARKTSTQWNYDDRDAWLLIGGVDEQGEFSDRIWYSFDNGVNWRRGEDEMAVPSPSTAAGPVLVDADALVELEARKASALDWKKSRKLQGPTIEGTEILWECPLIYFFGGKDQRMNQPYVCDGIWRGALARYTFIPAV